MPTVCEPSVRRAQIQWAPIAKAVGLVVAVALCYCRTLDGGFIWDDHLVLPAGPAAQSFSGLRDVWISTKTFDYYPLTYSLLWFEWHLFGETPLGYHLVTLALGVVNVFGLWAVLAALRVPGAWLGSLLFALHPLNVASIAWIAETKNTLSAAFYLLSLWLFVRSAVKQGRRDLYTLSVLAFALGALSKSSIVMLPCVLLVMAWWQCGAIGRRDFRKCAPFFVVSATAGLLTIWYHHRAYSPAELQVNGSLFTRTLIAGRAILFYAEKTILPVHLSMIYPRWDMRSASALACAPWLLIIAVGAVLWQKRDTWGRGPAAWFAYFVLTLLPVSGIAAGTMPAFAYVFDHLAYLATMGATGAAGAALIVWRRRSAWGLGATSLVILALAVGTLNRASDFSSATALWTSTLRENPTCPAAHNNLGLALAEQRKFPEAETQFHLALAEDPLGTSAAGNLGNALQQQGKWREAAAAYSLAASQQATAQDLNNYGVVCLQLGEDDRAIAQLRRAAAIEPGMLSPRFNLYTIAASRRDWSAALEELAACLRIDPDDVPSLDALVVLDLQVAPPGTIPPASVALANRAQKLSGGSDPVAMAIVQHSKQPSVAIGASGENQDILERIEQLAGSLR